MNGFSGALKLGDLDDFLSPADECVIVVPDKKTKQGIIKPKSKQDAQVASLSLSDCLACSGCVTSAETMLLESQSVGELLTKVDTHQIVITVSTASRRSLAKHFDVHPSSICTFLQTKLEGLLGPDLVITDVSTSEAVVIQETMRETRERSTTVLTSHCPGWTCYATKVLGDEILSLFSAVKSSEQIHGMVLKDLIPAISQVNRFRDLLEPLTLVQLIRQRLLRKVSHKGKRYHVLISPCFDKKLEILRPDYVVSSADKSVDLVLSSTELVDLLAQSTSSVSFLNKCDIDIYDLLSLRRTWTPSRIHGESGGYAHACATDASDSTAVVWDVKQNVDILEFKQFMRSRGFRNIQNVTRRVRNGKLRDRKLIEVMACPGGCPRGGGQVIAEKSIEGSTGTLWDRLIGLWAKPNQKIDEWEVDLCCKPADNEAAVNLRKLLLSLYGTEEAFLRAIRTEWKSLAKSEDRISHSDLKW